MSFPEANQAATNYLIAVLKDAPQAELAQQFVDLVTGEAGQKELQAAGFGSRDGDQGRHDRVPSGARRRLAAPPGRTRSTRPAVTSACHACSGPDGRRLALVALPVVGLVCRRLAPHAGGIDQRPR